MESSRNNKFLPHFPSLLSLEVDFYRQHLLEFFDTMLALDQAYAADSDQLLFEDSRQEAVFDLVAREPILLAGMTEVCYWLEVRYPELKFKLFVRDGDKVAAGGKLLSLNGKVNSILKLERILLNFLGRMSGVALYTNQLARRLKFVKLASTRKTIWPLLDKKAVLIGGGITHRLSRAQALMIKDNQFADFAKLVLAVDFDFADFAKKIAGAAFLQIEFDNLAQVELLRSFGEKYQLESGSGLQNLPALGFMLDNFNHMDILKAIPILADFGFIEVSGSIDETNIPDFDLGGVDFISMGALTKKAKSLDLALDRV